MNCKKIDYLIIKRIIMILIIFASFMLINRANYYKYNKSHKKVISQKKLYEKNEEENCQVIYQNPQDEYNKLLENNRQLIEFFSTTYKIDCNVIFEDLRNRSKNYFEFNENNLAFLNDNGVLRNYDNKEKALFDYFEEFSLNNPNLIDNSITGYHGNRQYVEGLVKFFSKFYPNVNYKMAISIGAAESGYYTASSMLKVNNVYGGMRNGKLISHKNIESGVLEYIKYLDRNYFSKGINSLEQIGSIYCPSYENGRKTASSHWLSLVNNAMNTYDDNNNISIEELVNLKNI